jgi:hypothetical protein
MYQLCLVRENIAPSFLLLALQIATTTFALLQMTPFLPYSIADVATIALLNNIKAVTVPQ